ncbi:amine acid ABC transporter, permease protein, 3-TM region, His/Glu/Gln/Arg/opine family [Tistlia consotensis]|uniref:Amine acid ABC transporter, permease protein, 3-TM region, His/Glu/Gln/Arg/opine family n=1 Tax=Tistlia consotensis USBA 355 TaxID=560819 RepID=A0A1Y6BFI6_9PROT|nr:amine acid ABC transporter, permease protein, 3-TM region, His/Glu/Gln/Arg/opine family [Tistlia consotensis USBA 355]SNR55037.1 amine acid ABC transporter, permease protein, 3-TM region, His/Glu/Gln/Arg/opine family [Tistlia consotensis]
MVMSESQVPQDDGSIYYPPGQHPNLPPPPGTVGIIGWLRENLFSSPVNAIATLATLVLLYLAVVPIVNWAVVDAVVSGPDRRVCDLGRTATALGEGIASFSAADYALDPTAAGLSESQAAKARGDQRAASSAFLGIESTLGVFLDRYAATEKAGLVPASLEPVIAKVQPQQLAAQLHDAVAKKNVAAAEEIYGELKPLTDWGSAYNGACWVVVKSRVTLFLVGFYDRDQLWRPLLAFLGLLIAVPPLLFTGMPFRRRLMWFSAAYPLIAYYLLTGVALAHGPLRLVLGALVLAAALVPFAWPGVPARRRLLVFSYVAPVLAVVLFFALGPERVFGFEPATIQAKVTDAMAAADSSLNVGQVVSKPGGLLEQFLSGDLYVLGLPLSPLWWLILIASFAWGLVSVLRQAARRASEAEWRSRRPLVVVVALLAGLILFAGNQVNHDGVVMPTVGTDKWGGLLATLISGVVGISASLPIGIVLALGRRSRLPVVRALSIAFIEAVRGVPLITVLFMSSVMLPLFLPEGVNFDKFLRALIGVALFASAYMAEVVRGGLQAIPKGQYEAADALGLTYWKNMRLIILPQALKIVIPGIVNTFIGLFKDTTLLGIIGILDLLQVAKSTNSDANWIGFFQETYVFVGLVFFSFCFTMSRYSIYLEKKLDTGHRRR